MTPVIVAVAYAGNYVPPVRWLLTFRMPGPIVLLLVGAGIGAFLAGKPWKGQS